MVVGDGLSFNDVVDGLVYDREGYDVPFLRFGDAGVDLELDGIEEFVDKVLEGGGFDIGHLVGLDYLDIGKEVGGFVGGVGDAVLYGLSGESYLVEVLDGGDFGVFREGAEDVNPAADDIVLAGGEVLCKVVRVGLAVVYDGVALGVEGFGQGLLIDVVLGAILENAAGSVIGTSTGVPALGVLVDVGQIEEHIAQDEILPFCEVGFLEADEPAASVIEFLVDDLEAFFIVGEVLAFRALGNGFCLGAFLLVFLHIVRQFEDALVHRGHIVEHRVVEYVIQFVVGLGLLGGLDGSYRDGFHEGRIYLDRLGRDFFQRFGCEQAGVIDTLTDAKLGFVAANAAEGAEEFLLLQRAVLGGLAAFCLHEVKDLKEGVYQTVVGGGLTANRLHIVKEGVGQDVLEFSVPVSHRLTWRLGIAA